MPDDAKLEIRVPRVFPNEFPDAAGGHVVVPRIVSKPARAGDAPGGNFGGALMLLAVALGIDAERLEIDFHGSAASLNGLKVDELVEMAGEHAIDYHILIWPDTRDLWKRPPLTVPGVGPFFSVELVCETAPSATARETIPKRIVVIAIPFQCPSAVHQRLVIRRITRPFQLDL
jgi:hypothetical protein